MFTNYGVVDFDPPGQIHRLIRRDLIVQHRAGLRVEVSRQIELEPLVGVDAEFGVEFAFLDDRAVSYARYGSLLS